MQAVTLRGDEVIVELVDRRHLARAQAGERGAQRQPDPARDPERDRGDEAPGCDRGKEDRHVLQRADRHRVLGRGLRPDLALPWLLARRAHRDQVVAGLDGLRNAPGLVGQGETVARDLQAGQRGDLGREGDRQAGDLRLQGRRPPPRHRLAIELPGRPGGLGDGAVLGEGAGRAAELLVALREAELRAHPRIQLLRARQPVAGLGVLLGGEELHGLDEEPLRLLLLLGRGAGSAGAAGARRGREERQGQEDRSARRRWEPRRGHARFMPRGQRLDQIFLREDLADADRRYCGVHGAGAPAGWRPA